MAEFHEIRGSVILVNEVFGFATPDVNRRWLLHPVNQYSIGQDLKALTVAEMEQEPERAELLLKTERFFLEQLPNPRNMALILARFGMDEFTEEPLRNIDVAEKFGINKGRVGVIEAMVLRKFRHPIRSRKLLPFLMRAPIEELAVQLTPDIRPKQYYPVPRRFGAR